MFDRSRLVAARGSVIAAVLAVMSSSLVGCVSEPATPVEIEDGVAVPDGKADDFLSESAYEYVVQGHSTVVLEAEYAEATQEARLQRVKELVGYKQICITWFLTEYLLKKKSGDSNYGFGGFGGMAKGGAYEDLEVVPIDALTYGFTFRQIIAGGSNLMTQLPLEVDDQGKSAFDLEIGKPSNHQLEQLESGYEWYRDYPWSSWNPDSVSAEQKETLTLAIERERASSDAWFDYAELFADGKLTIDVHFGWDYHNDYHITHSQKLFKWLDRRKKFTPPVESFEQLERDSGPFTRTIDANGREIQVEVRVFYGKDGSSNDPSTDAGARQLELDMRASLAQSDVMVYVGHSGPFYGFAMGNWRSTYEGDLDDSEMSSVEMPEERYQIVFAEGCDTYHIGEAFRSNPAKPNGKYLDVITTTATANSSTPAAVQDFIGRLIDTDFGGNHQPRTVKSLLSDLDSNSYWYHTMYGIHGIDDNPALHPYAQLDNLCATCEENAECGGAGNMCITVGDSGKHCVAACTDDRGCPDGYECAAVASSSSRSIYARACVPTNFSCP